MQNKHNKRICIVTNSLGGGGLERAAAMQSQYLFDSGYTIFIISILDQIHYPYKGELLNLGKLKNQSNSFFNRFKRFKTVHKFIKENNIDLIIDYRLRKRWLSEWIISNFLFRKPTIYTVHNYQISNYIPTTNSFLNRPYQLSKKIVSVSKEIENRLRTEYGFSNIQTIYNPIASVDLHTESHLEKLPYNNYVLWYGRLNEPHKNLTLLIDAYQLSQLPSKGYKLIILGDGPDKEPLKNYVIDQKLDDSIVFLGYVENPLDFVKNAHFVLLTSRFEGFPMVIPEALSCEVPVISVDCKSGPNEIIEDKFNGLLVENYNKKALSNAMNEFISNSDLYKHCKANAKDSVRHLSVSKIREQWINLIENG